MTHQGHYFSTRKGRKLRNRIILRDLFTCQMCRILVFRGRDEPNTAVVDHIIPVELAPELETDEDNLRTVCKSCHDGPCQTIEYRYKGNSNAIKEAKLNYKPGGQMVLGYDETGKPLDPTHPWNS